MSFDAADNKITTLQTLSQSLSSRAMSFDTTIFLKKDALTVSIPFEQGDVFRRDRQQTLAKGVTVSIPFEQGDVFRPKTDYVTISHVVCLNPFRAGRCLSTYTADTRTAEAKSQSLSSRAMSFDCTKKHLRTLKVSIPFEQGDVFRHYYGALNRAVNDSLNPFRAGRCLSTFTNVLRSN